MSFIIRGLSNLLGTVLPCYYSYKTLKKPTNLKLIESLEYWAVYGAYTTLDWIANTFFISCFIPFYDTLSLCFFIYISVPKFGGSKFVYRKILAPFFARKERQFDAILGKLVSSIYALAPTIISNSINLIKDSILSSAIHAEIQEEDTRIPPSRCSSVVPIENGNNGTIQNLLGAWVAIRDASRIRNDSESMIRMASGRLITYDTDDESDHMDSFMLNNSVDLSIVKSEPVDEYENEYDNDSDVQEYIPPGMQQNNEIKRTRRSQPSRLAKLQPKLNPEYEEPEKKANGVKKRKPRTKK